MTRSERYEVVCALCGKRDVHDCPGGVILTSEFVESHPVGRRDARDVDAADMMRDEFGALCRRGETHAPPPRADVCVSCERPTPMRCGFCEDCWARALLNAKRLSRSGGAVDVGKHVKDDLEAALAWFVDVSEKAEAAQ